MNSQLWPEHPTPTGVDGEQVTCQNARTFDLYTCFSWAANSLPGRASCRRRPIHAEQIQCKDLLSPSLYLPVLALAELRKSTVASMAGCARGLAANQL